MNIRLGLNPNNYIKQINKKDVFTAILALGLMSVANANEAMEGVQQDRIAPIVAWGIRYTTWGAFSF